MCFGLCVLKIESAVFYTTTFYFFSSLPGPSTLRIDDYCEETIASCWLSVATFMIIYSPFSIGPLSSSWISSYLLFRDCWIALASDGVKSESGSDFFGSEGFMEDLGIW